METIIATTDLSANSRAGMHYAIHLAELRQANLVFVHAHYVLRATGWSDKTYDAYVQQAQETLEQEFSQFVSSVYKGMGQKPDNIRLELINELETVDGIIALALRTRASYLCISTRGGGTLRKWFGTTTGELLGKSPIPVVCVPSSYRFTPPQSVLYASDMTNYEAELRKVVAFAKPLGARLELLHVSHPWELVLDKELAEESLEKKVGYPVHFHYQDRNIEHALLDQIEDAMKASKPDLLVMFTRQERSFFERVFLSSKAEEYSFSAKVPLLCFRKEPRAGL